MSDKPPLIFQKRLGALFAANPDAKAALDALPDGKCRVEIKRTAGNNRRMALYWVMLGIVAPMLSERCKGDALDAKLLHRVLKDRKGLCTETVLPSGEIIKNYDSISFASMPENERAEFIDWAFATLSKWIGVEVETLIREAQREAA